MLEFHNIANVFPLMPEDKLVELAEDIETNGLRHPVVLFEGKILDGRNRYLAARWVGVEPATREFEGTWEEAVTFVASENLMRRHLTLTQAAIAAERLANLKQGRRVDYSDGALSIAQAAALVGSNVRSVSRVRAVRKHGTPELIAAMEAGQVALKPAQLLSSEAPEVQRAALAAGPEAVKDAVYRPGGDDPLGRLRAAVDEVDALVDQLVKDDRPIPAEVREAGIEWSRRIKVAAGRLWVHVIRDEPSHVDGHESGNHPRG